MNPFLGKLLFLAEGGKMVQISPRWGISMAALHKLAKLPV